MPQETAYSQPIPPEAIPATPESSLPADPESPPWGIPSAVLTWVASIGLLALIPNICTLPYLAYYYRDAPIITREILLRDKTFVFIFVMGWLPAHLLTLLVAWAVATRLGKFSFKNVLGLKWTQSLGFWKSFWLAGGLAIALFFIALLVSALFGSKETDLDRILQSSRAAALALAFLAVATAPLVEEVIYRGLLYSALQRAIGRWTAVAVVAVMFAGLHVVQYWPNFGAISAIALLSVVLTVIRALTGRLFPCLMIHLVFNGIQSLIIVFEPYLRTLFSRPEDVKGMLTWIQWHLN